MYLASLWRHESLENKSRALYKKVYGVYSYQLKVLL